MAQKTLVDISVLKSKEATIFSIDFRFVELQNWNIDESLENIIAV